MEYTPLLIKYKPKELIDINIDENTKDIINIYLKNNIMSFLITGNNSSGKSSLITVLLYLYYNKDTNMINDNTIYINLLKEQGINYYRNEIKNFCEINNFNIKTKKTIVLDDLDLLNDQCQQIFSVFISKYPNINFIISCNDILKIQSNIINKLELIKIKNIDNKFLSNIFDKIILKEKLIIDKTIYEFIIKSSNLSISNMLNTIDKINLINNTFLKSDTKILEKIISNILTSDLELYFDYCKKNKLKEAITHILNLCKIGYSVIDIYDEIFNYIKNNSTLEDKYKYNIIKIICKYINIFHNIHEDSIELVFFTNNIINVLK